MGWHVGEAVKWKWDLEGSESLGCVLTSPFSLLPGHHGWTVLLSLCHVGWTPLKLRGKVSLCPLGLLLGVLSHDSGIHPEAGTISTSCSWDSVLRQLLHRVNKAQCSAFSSHFMITFQQNTFLLQLNISLACDQTVICLKIIKLLICKPKNLLPIPPKTYSHRETHQLYWCVPYIPKAKGGPV